MKIILASHNWVYLAMKNHDLSTLYVKYKFDLTLILRSWRDSRIEIISNIEDANRTETFPDFYYKVIWWSCKLNFHTDITYFTFVCVNIWHWMFSSISYKMIAKRSIYFFNFSSIEKLSFLMMKKVIWWIYIY